VLDLCTGSGALAISAHRLFHQAQQAEGEEKEGEEGEGERLVVHASDVSGDALAVASINLESKGLSHSITLFQGDLFNALPPAPSSSPALYDVILCNPPYVDAAAMRRRPKEYRHEPTLALDGGEKGIDIVRRVLDGAAGRLTEQGLLVMEVGAAGKHVNAAMARAAAPASGARPALWARTSHSSREVCVMGREAAESVARLLR
jgi:ribosomal protein L3 glutamine methyltransferase